MSLDAVECAAGLETDSPLRALRQLRPEFVSGAEACRRAVLEPADPHGLSTGLRAALAARMARANRDEGLTAEYDAMSTPEYRPLATGAPPHTLEEPLASLARHADLVTGSPSQATAADIERLSSVGLDNPQIVALSELIAFVNFQTRIAQGLRLMSLS